MKIFKPFALLSLLFLWMSSCTGDFEETNTHPNNLESITAGSVLNPVLYELASRNGVQMRSVGAPLTQMFWVTDDYINSPFLYDFDVNIGGTTWRDYYRWLNNIKEMETAAIRDEMHNYEAIALTLKAYAFSMLTDCFGDVPMEGALQAEEGIWYAEFTPQERIYEIILDDLERANTLYTPDEGMIYVSDILFNNSVDKWRRFTNSLHLRLLLRVSGRAETDAFTKMTAMINNPAQYPVFESNEEGAVLHIEGIPPLLSPWDRPQDFGTFRYYSDFFIDNLNNFKDPRLPLYASEAKNQNTDNIGFIGQPVDFESPLPDSIATPSGVRNALATEPLIIPFMSYAEVEFIKAELAQRGYISGAEEHYKKGVTAAIEMWGLEMPVERNQAGEITSTDAYFDNEHTKYDGTLEIIMLQKYYALFFTDYQAWFEHRRTGLPVLGVNSQMRNGGEMPSRLYYPLNEIDRNNENYKKAVERMGGDKINVKVWWDVD